MTTKSLNYYAICQYNLSEGFPVRCFVNFQWHWWLNALINCRWYLTNCSDAVSNKVRPKQCLIVVWDTLPMHAFQKCFWLLNTFRLPLVQLALSHQSSSVYLLLSPSRSDRSNIMNINAVFYVQLYKAMVTLLFKL